MTGHEPALQMHYSEEDIKRFLETACSTQPDDHSARLYISTHALQGLLSFRDYYDQTTEPCRQALALADELLRQANQKP